VKAKAATAKERKALMRKANLKIAGKKKGIKGGLVQLSVRVAIGLDNAEGHLSTAYIGF
jgi:hypothetical protein